jgi:hypothetical protein
MPDLRFPIGKRRLPWLKRIFGEGRNVTFEPAAALVDRKSPNEIKETSPTWVTRVACASTRTAD